MARVRRFRRDAGKTVGFIGSGHIGSTVARLAIEARHQIVLSNSRGPESLADALAELGPRASAATSGSVPDRLGAWTGSPRDPSVTRPPMKGRQSPPRPRRRIKGRAGRWVPRSSAAGRKRRG
ncbi:NAD(P)-binding domain-containing protein [Streptomyces sp. NBC_01476]|uniref:NAD(P)-binding domain-containing protein n=1 Tax=Streptomyces sp. NBC_01476 TaxID=2903881 RepID=UPI003FCD56AF